MSEAAPTGALASRVPADPSWRHVLPVSFLATAACLGVALGGATLIAPGVSPWPRALAGAFFAVLLWPVGLTLVGVLAGTRAQRVAAVIVVIGTAAQQLGAFPLPQAIRWSYSLRATGDAVRRDIALPEPTDPAWQRAWTRATAVTVAICTEEAVAPGVEATVALDGGSPVALDELRRTGRPGSVGWYNLPVTRGAVEGRPVLRVQVQRGAGAGPALRICGGRDDPARPGAGGSYRLVGGAWSARALADVPLPSLNGAEALSRYYVELRFYDDTGLPHAGIWY